ncbi:unnamed protein product [Bubo scandiacus]
MTFCNSTLNSVWEGAIAHVVSLEPELLRSDTDPFAKCPHLTKSDQACPQTSVGAILRLTYQNTDQKCYVNQVIDGISAIEYENMNGKRDSAAQPCASQSSKITTNPT